jgi:hypothetical protein
VEEKEKQINEKEINEKKLNAVKKICTVIIMSSYIQNYGFTKTLIHNENQNTYNEIKWKGNYDGLVANIDVGMNTNGNTEFVSMQLDNNDLRQLFGIQPIEMSLDKRIMNDFNYTPIVLEGALSTNKRGHKHKHKHKTKSHKKKKHHTRRNHNH